MVDSPGHLGCHEIRGIVAAYSHEGIGFIYTGFLLHIHIYAITQECNPVKGISQKPKGRRILINDNYVMLTLGEQISDRTTNLPTSNYNQIQVNTPSPLVCALGG